MNSPYPSGCDPRSPSHIVHLFTVTGESECAGKVQTKIETPEVKIEAFEAKIKQLKIWLDEAESTEFLGVNFLERELKALSYSYKDQILKLEAQ